MDLLHSLPDSQASLALRDAGVMRRHPRHTALHRAGEVAISIHLVISGHACVQTTTRDGALVILGVVGPGGLVGDDALLPEHVRYSTSGYALDDTVTLCVPRSELQRLRASYPMLDHVLVTALVQYLRAQRARLVDAVCLPAAARVLKVVLELTQEYGGGRPGTVVPLTQEMLACMAGTTRATVNQTLRAAEREGVLTLRRAQIRVDDPSGLAIQGRPGAD